MTTLKTTKTSAKKPTTKEQTPKVAKTQKTKEPSAKKPATKAPTTEAGESHLEKRFKRVWEELTSDLILQPQIKNVVPGRRYIYDFAIAQTNILFEIQGGVFANGRSGHSSGVGIMRDADKVNRAIINGYLLFVITPEKISADYLGELINWILANY